MSWQKHWKRRPKKEKLDLPPAIPEKDIQRTILDYLNAQGHYAIRVNTQGVPIHGEGGAITGFRPSPQRGVADILCCMKGTGRFLAVEVKTGDNKPSAEQDQFLKDITDRGGIGTVVWSLDELIADLKSLGL